MRHLIKNGTIVDGTGRQPYQADILVEDDRIAAVGGAHNEKNVQEIDAEGLFVVPGFIDVNNHSDTYWTLFEYPVQESLITQGVTTIIGGACGSSLAPLIGEEAIKSIRKYSDISKVQADWASFGEFVDFMKQRSFNPNFGSLVGHATLRRGILGDEVRHLREDELRMMSGSLDSAMKEGALGLSTGLVYSHARGASQSEITRLASVVQEHGGVYATHIRQEGLDLVASVKEAIAVAETTQVRLQISHLKACGRKSWPLQDRVLDMIHTAKAHGIDVTFDVYPYTVAGPVLYTLLPQWATEGGKEALVMRLKDPGLRRKILAEMKQSGFDYGNVVIAVSKIGRSLERRKVSDIASNQGRTPEEIIVDLLIVSDDMITTMIELMSKKNVEKAIADKNSIIASNGAGYAISYREKGDLVHPRCFGTFPRFLRMYALESKTLTISEAIEKITRIPAEKYGLIKEMGTLEKDKRADLVIFDGASIKDKATVFSPFTYAEGIRDVFINGVQVVAGGLITGKKAGRMLAK